MTFFKATRKAVKEMKDGGLNSAQIVIFQLLAPELYYDYGCNPVRLTVRSMAKRYFTTTRIIQKAIEQYIKSGYIIKDKESKITLTDRAKKAYFDAEKTIPLGIHGVTAEDTACIPSGYKRIPRGYKAYPSPHMKMSQRSLDQNRSEQNDSDSNESESRTLADASTIGSGIPEHKRVASEWLEQRLKQIEINKQKAKQKAKKEKEARDKQDDPSTE